MSEQMQANTQVRRAWEAEQREREKWAGRRAVRDELKPQPNVWDKRDLTPSDRQTCLELLHDGIRARKFAQPALRAVFGDEIDAKFLDDFLWYHVGDPVQMGGSHHPRKSPEIDDGLSMYRYDYSHILTSGYTSDGHLLHVRETSDPAASEKEHYLVIAGDMNSRQVARYRVNEVEVIPASVHKPLSVKLILTTNRFDRLDGRTPYDSGRTAASLMQLNTAILAHQEEHERQSYMHLSTQGVYFKSFDGHEQTVEHIDRAVRDRHFLAQLAIAAGVAGHNHAAIELPESYLTQEAA